MKKNTPPISYSLISYDIRWKLGVFLSFILCLISHQSYASQKSEEKSNVTKDLPAETVTTDAPIIYATSGIVIYGLNKISVKQETDVAKPKKSNKKAAKELNQSGLRENLKKISSRDKIKTPKSLVKIFPYKSENSYGVAKPSRVLATLNSSSDFKSIMHRFGFEVPVFNALINISLYEYSNPYVDTETNFFSFTRPPPFS